MGRSPVVRAQPLEPPSRTEHLDRIQCVRHDGAVGAQLRRSGRLASVRRRHAWVDLHVHHPPESARTLLAARDQLVDLLDIGGFRPQLQKWAVEPVGNPSTTPEPAECTRRQGSACSIAGTASMPFRMSSSLIPRHSQPGREESRVDGNGVVARASQRLADDLRTAAV